MLKKTLFASYVTQGYVSVIGVLLMPIYLQVMGAEAFGLIGIYLMLQTVVQLLDLGLTPTFSREISRYKAGALDADAALRLIRALEWVLGSLAVLVVLAFCFGSDWIALHWLDRTSLPTTEVARAVATMALAASLRWFAGLYRAGLIGLERQLTVNAAAAAFATLRFVVVVPVLLYASHTANAFFSFQVLVGVVELFFLRGALYLALPKVRVPVWPRLGGLRSIVPMIGAMGFMGGTWIFQSQIDKLILSKILPLAAYGHFTLAVMVAGGVLMLTPPLAQVLQPRLTILATQGKSRELHELYSVATQFVTALFGGLGITVALFAHPLLQAWTNNAYAADAAAPILFWYGLANAVVGLLVLPFLLQFAYGDFRLQIIGAVLSVLVLFPALIYVSVRYGAVGAGETICLVNCVYLMVWIPLVHRRLLRGWQWLWFLQDIIPGAVAIIVFLTFVSHFLPVLQNRLAEGAVIMGVFLCSALIGAMAGHRSRATVAAFVSGLMA